MTPGDSDEIVCAPIAAPAEAEPAPIAAPEPRFEALPKERAPIVGITITVMEDLPGGIPQVPDFTAALLMTIAKSIRHGGREIQLHHVRAGYEQDPHVPGEDCTCRPLVFRAEAASRIIRPERA